MVTGKLQQIIWQIMNGCPEVHHLHDDIKVVAETQEQLGEQVENVIKKFAQHGLTLNYSVCCRSR